MEWVEWATEVCAVYAIINYIGVIKCQQLNAMNAEYSRSNGPAWAKFFLCWCAVTGALGTAKLAKAQKINYASLSHFHSWLRLF